MTTQDPSTLGPIHNFVTNTYGDKYLYSVNRHVFNSIGSHESYKAHYGKSLFEADRLYFIVGTDSGLLIQFIKKSGVPNGSRYVFIEPTDIYPLVLPIFESIEHNQQFFLYDEHNWNDKGNLPYFEPYAYLEAVRIQKSFAVEDGYYNAYHKLWFDTKLTLTSDLWRLKTQFGTYKFNLRQIENLAENQIPASCLKSSFMGFTAVLLAGGPSLDEVLPWVKDNRDKLVVFAVSRISRRLLELDIQPDIVVSVDPHPESFDVSKHMLEFPPSVLFVHNNHVTPLLLGQWRGPNVFMDFRYPWKPEIDSDNLHGIGPTVSNCAINLAIEMGFSQLVLAGLDLCFSREGYSHAKGSDERDIGAIVSFIGRTIKTNGGWIADTDDVFTNSIVALSNQAADAKSKNCALINPCKGAAAIDEVTHTELENIQLIPLQGSAVDILHRAVPSNDSQSRKLHYHSVLKELTPIRHQLNNIIKLSRRAIKYNDGLFGRNGKKADFKNKIKMDAIEKELNKKYGKLSDLAKVFGMAEFVRVFSTKDNEDWQDDDVEQTGRAYYKAYITGATKLLSHINSASERVHSRLEEEKVEPDFSVLYHQWMKDEQPGRWFVFDRKTNISINKADNSTGKYIYLLENKYNDVLTLKEHSHMPQLRKVATLSGVASKAREHFNNKDKQALSRMMLGIETREDAEAKPLFHLAKGYFYELENNLSDALAHYTQVENHPAVEDALNRIIIISLENQDLDNALLSLSIQCQISHIYKPRYAELLRISGQTQKAIDVYTEYLSLVPQDLTTMLKLGLLYKNIGHKEGALWVFEHILDSDPHNDTANKLIDEIKVASC